MDNLPFDIIHLISAYLLPEDLLNLRLTCKIFDLRFQKLHLDAYFKCRTYFVLRPSLELLLKVAESKHGRRVKHLKFDLQTPYPTIDRDMCLEAHPDAANTKLISRGVTKLLLDQCQRCHETGDDTVLINKAFARLPNLKLVEFIYDSTTPSARTLSMYYMSFNFNYVPTSTHELFIGRRPPNGVSLARHFFTILLAAASNGVPLEQFSFNNIDTPKYFSRTDRINDAHFKLLGDNSAKFHSSRPSLKELDLCLDDFQNNQIPEGCQAHVYNFLSFFSDSLESLRICHTSPPLGNINSSLQRPPKMKRFSQLHTLYLHNMAGSSEGLIGFLRHFKRTLEVLRFKDFKLQDGKRGWQQVLIALNHEFQLYYFFLEALTENSDKLPLISYIGDWGREALFSVKPEGKNRGPTLYRKVLKALEAGYSSEKFWQIVLGKASEDPRPPEVQFHHGGMLVGA